MLGETKTERGPDNLGTTYLAGNTKNTVRPKRQGLKPTFSSKVVENWWGERHIVRKEKAGGNYTIDTESVTYVGRWERTRGGGATTTRTWSSRRKVKDVRFFRDGWVQKERTTCFGSFSAGGGKVE